jgi:hypothetical protein
MPKNAYIDRLRRWQALDRGLFWGPPVYLKTFAAQWHVHWKTIKRDLAAFAEVGQRTNREYDRKVPDVTYRYAAGVDPLFICNLKP